MKTETWIYLFLIFITVILPLIRGNKKKKAQQASENQPEKGGGFLETLSEEFKKMQEGKPADVVEERREYEYEVERWNDKHEERKEQIEFSYDDEYTDYDFTIEEKVHELPVEKPKKTVKLVDAYTQKEDESKEVFVFNPVDAVIYSEIFKRPEY